MHLQAPTVPVLGKAASELQSDFVVTDKTLFGTLHHIEGWEDFSSEQSEQSGYYFAVELNPPEGIDLNSSWVKWNKGKQVNCSDDNGKPSFVGRLKKDSGDSATGTFEVTVDYGAGEVTQLYAYNFVLEK